MATWPEKIASLEAHGWSLTRIAKEIKRSVQAVSDVKHGRTTAPTGMAAVDLHNLYVQVIACAATASQNDPME